MNTQENQYRLLLKKSEERYRAIFEGANDGIIACDLTTGKFLFSNKRMSAITGYSVEEILKLSVKDLQTPENLTQALEQFNKHAAGEISETPTVPILKKDGNIIYCDISTSFLDNTILIGFFRDVTDRKKAEDERERLIAELEAANKELDAFSSAVANDLRTPLRSIEGFASAIIEDYADKLDETGKDYFHRVIMAGQRMTQLIEALLTMSRLTRGEFMEKTVDLSALAEVAAYELTKKQPDRKVEFIIAKEIKAKGDIDMLRVVMDNLLDNAWKFTGERPSATIEFGVSEEIGHIVPMYFVKDNGTGFDMGFADKLFEPFKRLHSKSEFSGLGIGLATVRKIINKHGGKIWAESAPEKGATFYFTLG